MRGMRPSAARGKQAPRKTPQPALKVRFSDIEYLKIRVHNPYHGDLIELNPGNVFLFQIR